MEINVPNKIILAGFPVAIRGENSKISPKSVRKRNQSVKEKCMTTSSKREEAVRFVSISAKYPVFVEGLVYQNFYAFLRKES